MPTGLIKGSIRRSQLITTYGVGSVIPLEDESFMVAGIDRWQLSNATKIHEPRLERQLGVQEFVLPPAGEDTNDVPVVRFPEVYYCPSCRRLNKHKFFTSYNSNKCNLCGVALVPSRFVVVCEHGHIDDFPYYRWVHKGRDVSEGTDRRHDMRIDAGGVSASLSDIIISCSCGAARSLEGAFSRDALKPIVGRCTGRRPWLADQVECKMIPRTLQRGASNVYFSYVRSALSIPPWSEGAFKILNQYWSVLRVMPDAALVPTIAGLQLAKDTSFSPESLAEVVRQRRLGEASDSAVPFEENELRRQEYEALARGRSEDGTNQDFVCMPAVGHSDEVAGWFQRVMTVTRLREVRALQSFTRLLPPEPSDPKERRAPLARDPVDWLPAIEVQGEGVFLDLEMSRLRNWEQREDVVARSRTLEANYRNRCSSLGVIPYRTISARFLLAHTFAHVLINQWSLACGYPAAALRERLYVDEDFAAILIYTATTDSAGSLGGIVAQAELGKLEIALREAISTASWCSSDPLCVEADAAGVDSLNLAACHACVLLPEVSCEESNVFLDRALLVGTPDNPELGYFNTLIGV